MFLPVMAVHGTDHFRIRRFVNFACFQAASQDWMVDRITVDQIGDIFSSACFGGKVFAVVENAEDLKDQTLVDYHNSGGVENICFMLVFSSKVKKGHPLHPFLKTIEKYYEQPPFFKEDAFASEFLMEEFKSHGKILSKEIAAAMVSLLGTDLGFLFFEVLKCVHYCDTDTVTIQDVKRTMSIVLENSIFPLQNALGKKSIIDFLRQSQLIQKTHGADPTMKVSGLLGSTIRKWLSAAFLLEMGLNTQQASQKMEMNVWAFEKNIVPYTKIWGSKGLIEIVRVLAKSERMVKEGALVPWNYMVSGLVNLMQKKR